MFFLSGAIQKSLAPVVQAESAEVIHDSFMGWNFSLNLKVQCVKFKRVSSPYHLEVTILSCCGSG